LHKDGQKYTKKKKKKIKNEATNKKQGPAAGPH